MIQNLVVWGGTEGHDSLRWIHKAFHDTARKTGIPSRFVPDDPASVHAISPGATVIAADRWSQHLSPVQGADYVLHNFPPDHPVALHTDPRHLLRLQVWTNDAYGEEWAPCRAYDPEGRILFQPWGCDLVAEEFETPSFNPLSREAVFVGAIWSDINQAGEDMGNTTAIGELASALREHGIGFKHLTQVSGPENIEAVRTARLAPAITGLWQQQHNYMPCRVFKNPAYGACMFTNVPACNQLFDGATIPGEQIHTLVENALRLKRGSYEDLVRAQQHVVSNYTYRESLAAIGRALEAGKQ